MPASAVRRQADDSFGASVATLTTAMGTPRIIGFRIFGVSNGTPFPDFFGAFRVVVSGITGSDQVLAPNMSTVLELVRRGVMNHYPGLMPTLYPGELATVPTPFGSIDALWSAFQVLATKHPRSAAKIFLFAPIGRPFFVIA